MSVLGTISQHSVNYVLPTSHWPPWSAIASIGSGSTDPRAESTLSLVETAHIMCKAHAEGHENLPAYSAAGKGMCILTCRL